MRRCIAGLALAALAAPAPAWGGAVARCRRPPTLAMNIAATPVIVVARARSRTLRRKHGELTTRFVVEKMLKGHPVRRRITVEDCWGYKCASKLFGRGERAVLFLSPVVSARTGAARPDRYSLPGLRCRGGVHVTALRYRPTDAAIRTIFALTGHPLPPQSSSR